MFSTNNSGNNTNTSYGSGKDTTSHIASATTEDICVYCGFDNSKLIAKQKVANKNPSTLKTSFGVISKSPGKKPKPERSPEAFTASVTTSFTLAIANSVANINDGGAAPESNTSYTTYTTNTSNHNTGDTAGILNAAAGLDSEIVVTDSPLIPVQQQEPAVEGRILPLKLFAEEQREVESKEDKRPRHARSATAPTSGYKNTLLSTNDTTDSNPEDGESYCCKDAAAAALKLDPIWELVLHFEDRAQCQAARRHLEQGRARLRGRALNALLMQLPTQD
jgi:hypothetical protein